MNKIGDNVRQPKRSRSKTIVADTGGSKCFADLRYKNGTVFATFTDGSQYEYPLSRSDALDWFDDDSLGGYFNAMVR
jgi:hypothetical protein